MENENSLLLKRLEEHNHERLSRSVGKDVNRSHSENIAEELSSLRSQITLKDSQITESQMNRTKLEEDLNFREAERNAWKVSYFAYF